MSGLSITIHDVHPVSAATVANLAAWANGDEVNLMDLIDALLISLENENDIKYIVKECGDETYSRRRLAATLAFFDSYSEESPTD
jgi:hypothetical protein